MLALSPSSFVWPLEDLTSYQQSGMINKENIETNSDQSFFQSPIYDELVKIMGEVDGKNNTTTDKKLNHNASERDRRKKINSMYFSLHSLLPASYRDPSELDCQTYLQVCSRREKSKKKLSIPSTITRALKYIPELRLEVGKLDQQKEALEVRIGKSRKREISEIDQVTKKQRINGSNTSTVGFVSVNKLGDEEVTIQLCADKSNLRVSEILITVEEEGLILLSISSFESFGDKVFHNLHLQAQAGNQMLNSERLRKKLLSMYE